MQTVKNYSDGRDIHITLLEYRAISISGISASPALLLISRRLKTKLPTTSRLLQPIAMSDVRSWLVACQHWMKLYYDHGTNIATSTAWMTWSGAIAWHLGQSCDIEVPWCISVLCGCNLGGLAVPEEPVHHQGIVWSIFVKSLVLDTSPGANVDPVLPQNIEPAVSPVTNHAHGGLVMVRCAWKL